VIGIRRLKCFRCGKKAKYQWQICADGNQYRPICEECDIALNEMVLKFMGFPDWQEKMEAYRKKIGDTP
jgi:NAD-dependent SIR2 family protein deacetylase